MLVLVRGEHNITHVNDLEDFCYSMEVHIRVPHELVLDTIAPFPADDMCK